MYVNYVIVHSTKSHVQDSNMAIMIMIQQCLKMHVNEASMISYTIK